MHRHLIGFSAFVFFAFLACSSHAETFEQFLSTLHQEATAKGISQPLIEQVLPITLEADPSVIKKLKNQPESTFSFNKYFGHMVSDFRVKNGRKNISKHQDILQSVSRDYKVPKEVIVALWGVESAYGKLPGNSSIIRSLATLAYDSHRKPFFRKELINALKILDEGHIKPEHMKGSWAGAMGQCQFMPSSFLNYAADGNNDGRKDIWQTEADVFSSTANYLKSHGWKHNTPWGQRVILSKVLPADLKMSANGLSGPMLIKEWEKLGIKAQQGGFQKDSGHKARLFLPEGPAKKAYLVYNNFSTIMRWNNSSYFAFSVLSLADALKKDKNS